MRGRDRVEAWLRALEHRLQTARFASRPSQADLASVRQLLPAFETVLRDNIIDFWLPRCLDKEHGGYLVDFDSDGQYVERDRKGLVTQSRMLWFFSSVIASGVETPRNPRGALEEAAASGYEFLRSKLLDSENGGFYWEVNRPGSRVTRECKDSYGQAFALFALSQYALAMGDSSTRALAEELFQVMEDRLHDDEQGGYLEFAGRDWGPPPAGVARYTGPYRQWDKTTNTHLHLLEAVAAYNGLAPSPLARQRLVELIEIQTKTVMRSGSATSYDSFERDWRPSDVDRNVLVSYGHDLENIHLVIDACLASDTPSQPFYELFRNSLQHTFHNGFDWRRGGFYLYGREYKPAHRREKIWWVQAEALLGLLYAHKYFEQPQALDVFLRTWEFIDRELIDRNKGEWFHQVRADGTVARQKGHDWKAAYHNGRCMLRCIEMLRASPTPGD
jgi:mannose/cellobiose epimerase-like protein (N-acyl-D-glucosamine 2-epimerase family)